MFGTTKGVIATSATALVLIASSVLAAVLLSQNVSVSSSSQDSDVQFLDGGGGLSGFASLSLGSSGASATLSLTGVAGAASLQITDLLRIQNTDATQAYTVTLDRSAAPDTAVTSLVFTVLDSLGNTIATYDATSPAAGPSFNLPVSTIYDIRINVAIADGTAVGSLDGMVLQFAIAPA